MKEEKMHKALEGVKILEWGTFHGGPGAAAILGDIGAETIKIEQPHVGDPMRNQWQFGEVRFNLPNGKNLFFEAANRNKKSITLNLKEEKAREIAYKLVARSDVLITNFRQNIIEKLGMSYDKLSQINPQLIYATVSAFGPKGPDSHKGGFDFQAQARSGLMYAMGEPDMPPLLLHFGLIDQTTAIMASHAILTAVLAKERFGIGQEVHISLISSAMYIEYVNVLNALWMKQSVTRHKRTKADPLRNYYLCADEKWLCAGLPEHWESKWPVFCQAIGRPELSADPRFENRAQRLKNSEALISILDGVFAIRSRDEWLRVLSPYDIICTPVNTCLDLENDPQFTENDYITDFDDPILGKIRLPGYPIHFSKTKAGTVSLAPDLGENTMEVLKDLDYSEEEIKQFQEEGII